MQLRLGVVCPAASSLFSLWSDSSGLAVILYLSPGVTFSKNGPDHLPWLKNNNNDNDKMVVMLLLIMIAAIHQALIIFLETLISDLSLHPRVCAGISKPSTFWTALPPTLLGRSCSTRQQFFPSALHNLLLGHCVPHLRLWPRKHVGGAWALPALEWLYMPGTGHSSRVHRLTWLYEMSFCRMGNSDRLFQGWASKDRGPPDLSQATMKFHLLC